MSARPRSSIATRGISGTLQVYAGKGFLPPRRNALLTSGTCRSTRGYLNAYGVMTTGGGRPEQPADQPVATRPISKMTVFTSQVVLAVRIGQKEIALDETLGRPGAFADIRVRPRGGETYFVEVNYGCPDEAILRSLRRKYAEPGEVVCHGPRVVLVVDRIGRADWDGSGARVAAAAARSGPEAGCVGRSAIRGGCCALVSTSSSAKSRPSG